MRILDRYIIRQFLNVLLFALLTFVLIFVIVDLIENLDEFIDKETPRAIIAQYYIYYIPYIVVLSLPVAMLLASLFSMGQIARYNELTAMKSTGISLYRITTTLLILAFFISLITIAFGEKVVPKASRKKFEIKRVYLDKIPPTIFTHRANIYIQDREGRRIKIKYYDVDKKIANSVSVEILQGDRLVKRIDAQKMIWNGSEWVLQKGFERTFEGEIWKATPFDKMERRDFNFSAVDLAKIQKEPNEMDYFELKEFIKQVRINGGDPERWQVDLNLKIAFPFANFIIVLFGIPLAASRRRSGAAVGFAISLFICFVYFGIVRTSQSLGHNGTLPPLVAAWISNVVFGVIGLGLLIKVRK